MDISYISHSELLRLVQEHGTISTATKRQWAHVGGEGEKASLLPIHGVRYLYRGQTKRYSPCLPSIARRVKRPGRSLAELSKTEALSIFLHLIQMEWYAALLDRHPAFEWAASKGFNIPRAEFAQHYGVPTGFMDMTESLEVALYFATHNFSAGEPVPCTEGNGILYRMDWAEAPAEVSSRFRAIAIQPFARPFRQWAWSCELLLGESFEACPGLVAVEFAHEEKFANEMRRLAERDGDLFPPDVMAEVAHELAECRILPADITRRVGEDITSDPGGLEATPSELAKELEVIGFSVSDVPPDLLNSARMERLQDAWTSDKSYWEAEVAAGYELLLTRTSKDAAQPGAAPDG
jgi:FRG domain